jgi:hypothetical protein
MAGLRAILYIQFHEWWFRGFGHHLADRCVRTPNTCRRSTEVHSISVLSNSHSVINTNHGPYKLSEWKQHAQNNRLLSNLCPGDVFY